MKKHFYSHLVEIESLIVELHRLDLSDEEKKQLTLIAESNLHHAILDVILSELSGEDKKIFLTHLSCGDHDKVWKHLKEKVENIEDKIKKAAEQLKSELHKDIKEVKKK